MTAAVEPKIVGIIPEITRWGDTYRGVAVCTSAYVTNHRLAVTLVTDEGEPLSAVSVNLVDAPDRPAGEFYAADYSETEGLPDLLVALGVITLNGFSIPVGPYGARAKVARLTPAFGGPS